MYVYVWMLLDAYTLLLGGIYECTFANSLPSYVFEPLLQMR